MLTLTQEHINRAFRIASWYGRKARRAEISDLESAALEGLAKAARDWQPHRSQASGHGRAAMRSFWNFAVTRILGEMRDELRRLDYLTRTQRSKVSEDDRGVPALADDELEWVVPLEPLSLEGTVAADGDDTSALVDSVAEPRDPIAELELRDAVDRAGDRLPRHVRQIVAKRDIEGYTNAEVAEALDLSPGRVSQLRDAAFAKMRGHIGDSLRDAA